LHRLVEAYQSTLADLDSLDLIPLRWLHLTTQGIGFTDETSRYDVEAIADETTRRLADLPPVDIVFHKPVIRPEALALPPHPAGAVLAVRMVIRDAIASVWGSDSVPEAADRFDPHVSFAYVNADGPAQPALAALSTVSPPPAEVAVKAASLIVLERDDHLYRWDTFSRAPLVGNNRGISRH
jgi:hypothetical protein